MDEELKLNLQITKMNFLRIVFSKNFLFSVIGIIALLTMTVAELKLQNIFSGDVCFLFQMIFDVSFFAKISVLLATLPAVTGFCDDWNTQYIRTISGRTGVQRYAVHKVYACISGTFMTVFIAYSVFALIMCLKFPLITAGSAENLSRLQPFGCLISVSPVLYLLTRIICYAASCTLWASFGLAFSAYFPNRFVACSMPFLFCHLFETVLYIADGKSHASIWILLPYLAHTSASSHLFGNPILDFLYIIVLFVGLAVLVGEIFVHGVKRRMQNELV